jgi:hypothetical protein
LIDPLTLDVKLIDFGSSAFLNDLETKFTEYIGTFAYAVNFPFKIKSND